MRSKSPVTLCLFQFFPTRKWLLRWIDVYFCFRPESGASERFTEHAIAAAVLDFDSIGRGYRMKKSNKKTADSDTSAVFRAWKTVPNRSHTYFIGLNDANRWRKVIKIRKSKLVAGQGLTWPESRNVPVASVTNLNGIMELSGCSIT